MPAKQQVKQMTVRLPKGLWRALKLGLLQQDKSIQQWVSEKIEADFGKARKGASR